MISKIGRFRSPVFQRERAPSPHVIAIAVCVYFFGALGVYSINHNFLTMAWLLAGILVLTIHLTIEARGSFFNPYTLFFAAGTLLCLGGYFIV